MSPANPVGPSLARVVLQIIIVIIIIIQKFSILQLSHVARGLLCRVISLLSTLPSAEKHGSVSCSFFKRVTKSLKSGTKMSRYSDSFRA